MKTMRIQLNSTLTVIQLSRGTAAAEGSCSYRYCLQLVRAGCFLIYKSACVMCTTTDDRGAIHQE